MKECGKYKGFLKILITVYRTALMIDLMIWKKILNKYRDILMNI